MTINLEPNKHSFSIHFAGVYFVFKQNVQTLNDILCRFRALGRLETKYDDTMMDYYVAFIAMCKRASGIELTEEEGKSPLAFFIVWPRA